ncbi:50S ribosomal protein L25/general stress protein Ctc [Candidatus Endowatersipora endosymbiont of Watersipora subatra]|uniref:50S ribosomal protein L25/general stress protein Ctc n=1 Tax=Candidatus Endowatersipora endosymbiont of Watersipora subatra TaxID=3077946 RepID=UPI00312C92B8
MSINNQLVAQLRKSIGKGSARDLRRNSMIPAIIYGGESPPLPIALSYKEISMRIRKGSFLTTILNIKVNEVKYDVLPKNFQLDKVYDFIIHLDLLRVSKKSIVTVDIPISFENDQICLGIKRGGILNIIRHTIEVQCHANAIPELFRVDLTPFDLGDSVKVSAIKFPTHIVSTIVDKDDTIATISMPIKALSDGE